jgi:hypothetical protein
LDLQEELLKRIGEHHPQHEFFKVLAVRCSYLIFGKDHTKAVMEEISLNMEDSNREIVVDGLTLVAASILMFIAANGFRWFLLTSVIGSLLLDLYRK